jgi:hypothetical protein
MSRIKVTTRAEHYSGDNWKRGLNCEIIERSNDTIIRNADLLQLEEIVYRMNQNHDHWLGNFYYRSANPNDQHKIDYYIMYENRDAP